MVVNFPSRDQGGLIVGGKLKKMVIVGRCGALKVYQPIAVVFKILAFFSLCVLLVCFLPHLIIFVYGDFVTLSGSWL